MCENFTFQNLWSAALAMHHETFYNNIRPQRSDQALRENLNTVLQMPAEMRPSDPFFHGLAAYEVSRTVPKGDRTLFFNHVTMTVQAWNDQSLVDKAAALTEFQAQYNPQNKPLSALSKMAWLVCPHDWTMYDSRASAAIGHKDFHSFYATVQRLGFTNWVNAVRQVEGFPDKLFPERVWDKAMFILGGDNRCALLDQFANENPNFVVIAAQIANSDASQPVQAYLRARYGLH